MKQRRIVPVFLFVGLHPLTYRSRDIAPGIARRSLFDSWEGKDSCLLHSVQTNSGDHLSFYPVGTGGEFLEDKATGA